MSSIQAASEDEYHPIDQLALKSCTIGITMIFNIMQFSNFPNWFDIDTVIPLS